MTHIHSILPCLPAVLLTTTAIAGCTQRNAPRTATTQPSPVVLSREEELKFSHPTAMRAARPVKAGSPPLVYLLEAPGDVRVVDATTGQTLGAIAASARTLVSIDATAGVRVGGHELLKGPLPADHVYEIYATPIGATENTYRTETRTAPR